MNAEILTCRKAAHPDLPLCHSPGRTRASQPPFGPLTQPRTALATLERPHPHAAAALLGPRKHTYLSLFIPDECPRCNNLLTQSRNAGKGGQRVFHSREGLFYSSMDSMTVADKGLTSEWSVARLQTHHPLIIWGRCGGLRQLTSPEPQAIMLRDRRSGGTGRRAGFKIPSWQQGEGSTPSFGTGVLRDIQFVVKVVILRHYAGQGLDRQLILGRVTPQDLDLAGAVLVTAAAAIEHLHERGLACAVGPEQGKARPRLDLEADVADRRHLAKVLADVAYGDDLPRCILGPWIRAGIGDGHAAIIRPGPLASTLPSSSKTL